MRAVPMGASTSAGGHVALNRAGLGPPSSPLALSAEQGAGNPLDAYQADDTQSVGGAFCKESIRPGAMDGWARKGLREERGRCPRLPR